jgi:hypothetical protein
LYLATGKGKRHREVATATNNYRTITGKDGSSYILQSPRLRRYWLDFARGRDLFLLGSFDINKAIGDIDLPDQDHGIVPYSIIAQGYNMPYSSIAEEIHLRVNVRLRHYVRQYRAWFEQTHFGHWYEIGRAARENPNILDLPPETMHLRALEQLNRIYDADNNEGLAREQAKLLPIWDWVTKQNPVKHISETDSLVPIDNYELLKDTGIKLHNCATNYGHLIQTKQALLVTYYKGQKPIALCQYNAQGKIEQALGPCNTKVSKTTMQSFQEYQITI